MNYLFSRHGRAKLQEFMDQDVMLAFDFDGTLAPIVSTPGKAKPSRNLLKVISALNREHQVAVITGRSLADLKRRLGFKPDFAVGNHGLEGLLRFQSQAKTARRISHQWLRQLDAFANETVKQKGILLESKGYTLSLHFRLAKNKALAARRLKAAIAKLDPPPRVIAGKSLFNLVPQASPHKGNAVNEILKQAGVSKAFYIGDDDTDEDVFRMCDPNIFTVRVGTKRGSLASYYVKNIKDVERLIQLLVQWGSKQPGRATSISR